MNPGRQPQIKFWPLIIKHCPPFWQLLIPVGQDIIELNVVLNVVSVVVVMETGFDDAVLVVNVVGETVISHKGPNEKKN